MTLAATKLLIVEDQPSNIDVLGQAVSGLGDVHCARTGMEALRIARAVRPDVVLLDVGLPDFDGYEVCRRLRREPGLADSRIIFVTGRVDAADEAHALEIGGVDYIRKPVDIRAVQARVRTQLQQLATMRAAQDRSEQFGVLLDRLPLMLVDVDAAGVIRFANRAASDWLLEGRTPGDALVRPGDALSQALDTLLAAALQGRAMRETVRLALDGRPALEASVAVVPKRAGERMDGALLLVDAVNPVAATDAPAARAASPSVPSAGDAVLITDPSGLVLFANSTACRALPTRLARALGMPAATTGPTPHISAAPPAHWQETVDAIAGPDGTVSGYCVALRHATPAPAPCAQGLPDLLTALPGRASMERQLAHALERPVGDAIAMAVLHVDIDNFGLVNELAGTHCGDEVLRLAAAQVVQQVGLRGSVYRLGGDDFHVVIDRPASTDEAEALAARIVAALSRVALPAGLPPLSASVGLSLAPQDARTPGQLLHHANSALARAMQRGPGSIAIYSEDADTDRRRTHVRAAQLRSALERDEIQCHYQPKVDAATGHIVGVEVLARWFDAAGRSISPAEFIAVAEGSGLMTELGARVLQRACLDAARWSHRHTFRLAVNVSASQLLEPGFVDSVRRFLAESGFPSDRLELELTESVLADSTGCVSRAFATLRAMGIKIAIDDFGTGYSALSYLKRFDVDTLKIDQSFVREMLSDKRDDAIVRAITQFAVSLGLRVVAEGVETSAQAARLLELECGIHQGYHYSAALDPVRMAALFDAGGVRRVH